MKRVCQKTGKMLHGEEALKQAIYRTLITPKGSCLCNRRFGSRMHQFIDKPFSEVMPLLSSEVMSSLKNISEFSCKEVDLHESGKLTVMITGNFLEEGQVNVSVEI